ncbi:MAG: hypothetical protein ISS70_20520 [Phycisphaerae bacterium]|nr:hypothetical protein [Phycisphaerae bacterium]
MPDMIKLLNASTSTDMSQKQIDKIVQTFEKNPEADQSKAVQYRKMDET